MQVLLDKKYRITATRHCWKLEQCTGVDLQSGALKYRSLSYHPTFSALCHSLCDRALRESTASTLKELAESVREANARTVRLEALILEELGRDRTNVVS